MEMFLFCIPKNIDVTTPTLNASEGVLRFPGRLFHTLKADPSKASPADRPSRPFLAFSDQLTTT